MGLNFEQGKFFSVPVCPELLCQGWAGGCPQLPLVHGKEVFGFPPLPGDGIVGQGQGRGGPGAAARGRASAGLTAVVPRGRALRPSCGCTDSEAQAHSCVGEGCGSVGVCEAVLGVSLGCPWEVLGVSLGSPGPAPGCPQQHWKHIPSSALGCASCVSVIPSPQAVVPQPPQSF